MQQQKSCKKGAQRFDAPSINPVATERKLLHGGEACKGVRQHYRAARTNPVGLKIKVPERGEACEVGASALAASAPNRLSPRFRCCSQVRSAKRGARAIYTTPGALQCASCADNHRCHIRHRSQLRPPHTRREGQLKHPVHEAHCTTYAT